MLEAKSSAAVRPASARARAMPRSAIREIMALAAGRPEVIHLEVGEPDASTPEHIIEGAFAAARAGWPNYSPHAGLPPLRKLIAGHASARWGVQVASDQVVVPTGAIGALDTAIASVVDAGDE